MKSKTLDTVTEESILTLSIVKWIILASIIGIFVGGAITLFIKIITFSISVVHVMPYYYVLLPFVLVMAAIVTQSLSPDSQGHGTEKVIRSIHKDQGKIRLRVVPVKLFTTISTIVFGGSVGQEGPCAQIGAAMASGVARLFKFNSEDRKKFVICGVSAGFSAVFGTPIAGAIFSVEVLFMGKLLYSVLLPALVSAMVSFQIAQAIGLDYHHYLMSVSQVFDIQLLLLTVLSGLFFGLVSVLFIEVMSLVSSKIKSINALPALKTFVTGLIIVLLAYVFSTDYLGLGLDVIDRSLSGQHIIWYAFLIKIFITSLTLGAGGSGGVLTPLFFIGSTAGVVFADFFGVDRSMFAAFGFVSVLAGAANTPLAACVLAIELFGSMIAPYATIACVISFFMSGYRSIFPSQVLSSDKTRSIVMRQGEEVEGFETHYNYQTRRLMAKGRLSAKRFIKRQKSVIKTFFI
tara:strand:+ start:1315 stop:2697 length:1383 start_codon:yes stop_codon:yes gene_type:complete